MQRGNVTLYQVTRLVQKLRWTQMLHLPPSLQHTCSHRCHYRSITNITLFPKTSFLLPLSSFSVLTPFPFCVPIFPHWHSLQLERVKSEGKTHWRGIGRPAGGALMPYFSLNCRLDRKTGTLYAITALATAWVPSRRKGVKRYRHNSANEKPLHSELPVYSSGLFVYKSPLKSALSSIKGCSSPLFSGFANGFDVACVSQVAISVILK